MRNVDPDNDVPWRGHYTTYNYVKYQPANAGADARINPEAPDSALVMAYGAKKCSKGFVDHTGTGRYSWLGLGTVHPKARVSHFGFCNQDPDQSWNHNEPVVILCNREDFISRLVGASAFHTAMA